MGWGFRLLLGDFVWLSFPWKRKGRRSGPLVHSTLDSAPGSAASFLGDFRKVG